MMKTISIGSRLVGEGQPVYIVAEVSANHNGSFDRAVKVIEATKAAGADAVKVQTYTADTLTINSSKECFRIGKGTVWEGRTLYDLYKEASMPWEWQPKLKSIAEGLGLGFFSTPFDPTAVEFLERMDVPVHKIASFELVDLPLIRLIARTRKPMILSTGMATVDEIREAVDAFVGAGGKQLALLKCSSAYPAPPGEMNLGAIRRMSDLFNVPVGLSDHSLGVAVPVAAVAVGACIIEKHLTFSRNDPGPDSTFSLEPGEFKTMVEAVRVAEKALRCDAIGVSEVERPNLAFRRSLFAVKALKAGELFSGENVCSIRPGNGLHPRCYEQVIGRKASVDIDAGTPLKWDLLMPEVKEP